ncbi:hypothetical protein JXB27_00620 [Candidatus Woesearchaeota archaeon]|nr:hypothetical protein [Candidatus Woesearchaeota archaeon]
MVHDRVHLDEEIEFKTAYKNGFRIYDGLMHMKDLHNKFHVLPPMIGSPEAGLYRDIERKICSLKESDVSDLAVYLATEELELRLNDGTVKDLSDKILELIEDEEAKDRLRDELPR